MRRLLQRMFAPSVIRLANRFSSRPNRTRVYSALTQLYKQIEGQHQRKDLVIPFDAKQEKFIIFSDQHKGVRNDADNFALAERNYLAALTYYDHERYTYICLGDSEELWENHLDAVHAHNEKTFEIEKLFLQRGALVKIFGNHDLYWGNDPLAGYMLKKIYGQEVKIYEGLILKPLNKEIDIYLTHGHQGDLQSDGNWFSKWFVATIWERLQAYLQINPNTPATNDNLKTLHNKMMYEWSAAQSNLLLVTGHTHQPVFASVTHIEKLYQELQKAKADNNSMLAEELQQRINKLHLKGDTSLNFEGYKDTYFNSGCCCFDDGDITGIEITEGNIKLIRWKYNEEHQSVRSILEESSLESLKLS